MVNTVKQLLNSMEGECVTLSKYGNEIDIKYISDVHIFNVMVDNKPFIVFGNDFNQNYKLAEELIDSYSFDELVGMTLVLKHGVNLQIELS